MLVITYVVFFLTGTIYRVLGRRGSLIVTGIFAVLVTAIAVQYVVDGLKTVYPQFMNPFEIAAIILLFLYSE